MVVIEFRIPLPLSVEEFHRGQLHMVAQKSLEVTGGDEGVEWIRNEPYDNTDGHWGVSPITGVTVPHNKGQYTLKRYHIKSKIPAIAATVAPHNALYLIEEAWNAYPHCKTVIVNGYLDIHKFRIDIETMHVEDNCFLDNALSLGPEELKARKVEYLDILDAYGDPKGKDYRPEWNAHTFKSAKTGRGPLSKGWEKSGIKPLMCAYKLVRADFKYFGLQGTVEGSITGGQRDLFAKTLCQAYATVDSWAEKTMEEVRHLEEEVARRSEAAMVKLREKERIPPVAHNGYHLALVHSSSALSTAAGAGASAHGPGA